MHDELNLQSFQRIPGDSILAQNTLLPEALLYNQSHKTLHSLHSISPVIAQLFACTFVFNQFPLFSLFFFVGDFLTVAYVKIFLTYRGRKNVALRYGFEVL